jgi:hypothetical protein
MITTERLDALLAVEKRAVRLEREPFPASGPLTVRPRKHTVAVGYLKRAGLIRETAENTVELTDRGKTALEVIRSESAP